MTVAGQERVSLTWAAESALSLAMYARDVPFLTGEMGKWFN